MKSRVSLLATRIAAIQEEFSRSEIREAVKLLKQQSSTSEAQAQLAHDWVNRGSKPKRKRKTKPIEAQRSKAVLDLAQEDPEKYAVLSEFDILLRKGSILPEVMELKMLGKSLSKTFSSKSSRREVISKLMKVLAERPLPEIREVITAILSTRKSENDDSDYYKLAQFIITGKAPAAQRQKTV